MGKMQFHTSSTEVCQVHIALDEIHPAEWGTAAAMFSRSNDGILAIADKVNHEKAERFQEKFYVQYGHSSIGDLTYVKLFVEGIPFYVAAALEHHSAFAGQESSTRYIDFSKQAPAYDADKELYAKQIDFYLHATEQVKENIHAHAFNAGLIPEDKSESAVHNRAIAARAFDITRCLLPLGATTNVAWYGSVRSIKRHLAWLIDVFDLEAVKPYARQILRALRDVYPESVEENPRAANPWPMGSDHAYKITGMLDFGSWRDLNRHRIGFHKFLMPSETSPFHPWYDKMLMEHGINIFNRPDSIDLNSTYLGNSDNVRYYLNEEQFEYVCKLRSKPSVHPTLRQLIQENYEDEMLDFEIDTTPDPGAFGYYLQRGNETILIKS